MNTNQVVGFDGSLGHFLFVTEAGEGPPGGR